MAAVFFYSLSVSAHCAGMCGPLLANSLWQQNALGSRRRWTSLVQYQVGRATSYTLAGAVCGFLGKIGPSVTASLHLGTSAFAFGLGLVLLGMGVLQLTECLYAAFKLKPVKLGFFRWTTLAKKQLDEGVFKALKPALESTPISFRSLVLGFFTVFLPCMTLSPALLTAAASGSAQTGAQFLFAFYLGTLPIMSAVGIFSVLGLPRWLPTQWISAFFLLTAGGITILRATPLHHWLH